LTIEKSDKAPDMILKLSEIMQYVLYEVKGPEIGLLKEINYISSYLDLEKLRYGDAAQSNLSIKGKIDNISVPPLLFLPFIENCFKHGFDDNGFIKIHIKFEKILNNLHFTVENNIGKKHQNNMNQGIGLMNVKKRLKLLYKDRFKLEIKNSNNRYMVQLKIPINEN
jgi:LytS/YehU family sensor histidine kinase